MHREPMLGMYFGAAYKKPRTPYWRRRPWRISNMDPKWNELFGQLQILPRFFHQRFSLVWFTCERSNTNYLSINFNQGRRFCRSSCDFQKSKSRVVLFNALRSNVVSYIKGLLSRNQKTFVIQPRASSSSQRHSHVFFFMRSRDLLKDDEVPFLTLSLYFKSLSLSFIRLHGRHLFTIQGPHHRRKWLSCHLGHQEVPRSRVLCPRNSSVNIQKRIPQG